MITAFKIILLIIVIISFIGAIGGSNKEERHTSLAMMGMGIAGTIVAFMYL